MEPLNLATLPKYLTDEGSAWELLERLRWNGTPVCPHCGTADTKHYFIAARSGERTTRKGTVSFRRLWKCRNKECRKQFSVLVGTIFESSHVPVSKWLLALWLTSAAKNGISALELQRHLGLGSYQTAWFMSHRIREAMKREPVASLLSGTVVADETWYGGKPKNRHRQGRDTRLVRTGGPRAGIVNDKTPVLALIETDSHEARAQVMTTVNGDTLRDALVEQIDTAASKLHTDGHGGYREVGQKFVSHEYVDHSHYEYVRGDVSTNAAESFFAQFKRSLDGTHHAVSRHHLHRYVTEFEFRWNTNKMSDFERLGCLVEQVPGRRLTYRPLRFGNTGTQS
jgi:hypothetical protein